VDTSLIGCSEITSKHIKNENNADFPNISGFNQLLESIPLIVEKCNINDISSHYWR
jgi:hypothetical protein